MNRRLEYLERRLDRLINRLERIEIKLEKISKPIYSPYYTSIPEVKEIEKTSVMLIRLKPDEVQFIQEVTREIKENHPKEIDVDKIDKALNMLDKACPKETNLRYIELYIRL